MLKIAWATDVHFNFVSVAEVAAFVEHHDHERGDIVLMEHRRDCDQWCLLGGRVEPNQSVEETLRQEVIEESGLAFRVQVDDFGPLAVSAESTELRFFTHDELRTPGHHRDRPPRRGPLPGSPHRAGSRVA